MNLKATSFFLQQTFRGDWVLGVTLEKSSVRDAMDLYDRHKPGVLCDVTVKRHREARSLTANAYFHTLCNKLAAKLDIENDAMKRFLVCQYGTVAEVDGFPVSITIPKGTKVEDFYPYAEWMSGDADSDTYVLYKQTHALNSEEFARLIDGTVAQCKLVGVETLPPDELARLYAQADKKQGDPEKR